MILQFCSFIMMVKLVNGINLSGQRRQSMLVQGNKQNGITFYLPFFAFNRVHEQNIGELRSQLFVFTFNLELELFRYQD
jgi:hypothetical protein